MAICKDWEVRDGTIADRNREDDDSVEKFILDTICFGDKLKL
jgi:hypothetical protein